MAIQDSNGERRNLIMASLGFILYFLGDGYIIDGKFKIQLLSISFNKPEVIGIFAWLMLFWFAIRYWQTHVGKAISTLVSDIIIVVFHGKKSLLIWYVKRIIKLPYNEDNGFIFGRFSIDKNGWVAHYSEIDVCGINANANPTYTYKKDGKDKTIRLSGLTGYALIGIYTLIACCTKQGFSSYSVPYILFYTALIIAVFNVFICK